MREPKRAEFSVHTRITELQIKIPSIKLTICYGNWDKLRFGPTVAFNLPYLIVECDVFRYQQACCVTHCAMGSVTCCVMCFVISKRAV